MLNTWVRRRRTTAVGFCLRQWGYEKAHAIRAKVERIYMLIYVSKYVKATGIPLTIEDPQEHQADDQHDTHDP